MVSVSASETVEVAEVAEAGEIISDGFRQTWASFYSWEENVS